MSDTTPNTIPEAEAERRTKIPQGDNVTRALDDSPEVGRTVAGFHFPVVKQPTGVVQFRSNGAEVVTIDRLGDVRRGQVIQIPRKMPPNAAALDFCRGLVSSGNFSHVAEGTPLGQPEEFNPNRIVENVMDALRPGPESAPIPNERLQSTAPTLDYSGEPLNVALDFNAQPPTATFSPADPPEKKHSVPGAPKGTATNPTLGPTNPPTDTAK